MPLSSFLVLNRIKLLNPGGQGAQVRARYKELLVFACSCCLQINELGLSSKLGLDSVIAFLS